MTTDEPYVLHDVATYACKPVLRPPTFAKRRGSLTCSVHGGEWDAEDDRCQTSQVLDEVCAERARQFALHGANSDLTDGTGPDAQWLRPISRMSAERAEAAFRDVHEARLVAGNTPTWCDIVREEVSEAFKESDPGKLRDELLQVAALCVSWVEKIDAR